LCPFPLPNPAFEPGFGKGENHSQNPTPKNSLVPLPPPGAPKEKKHPEESEDDARDRIRRVPSAPQQYSAARFLNQRLGKCRRDEFRQLAPPKTFPSENGRPTDKEARQDAQNASLFLWFRFIPVTKEEKKGEIHFCQSTSSSLKLIEARVMRHHWFYK
jgi:hypothetical protein